MLLVVVTAGAGAEADAGAMALSLVVAAGAGAEAGAGAVALLAAVSPAFPFSFPRMSTHSRMYRSHHWCGSPRFLSMYEHVRARGELRGDGI